MKYSFKNKCKTKFEYKNMNEWINTKFFFFDVNFNNSWRYNNLIFIYIITNVFLHRYTHKKTSFHFSFLMRIKSLIFFTKNFLFQSLLMTFTSRTTHTDFHHNQNWFFQLTPTTSKVQNWTLFAIKNTKNISIDLVMKQPLSEILQLHENHHWMK